MRAWLEHEEPTGRHRRRRALAPGARLGSRAPRSSPGCSPMRSAPRRRWLAGGVRGVRRRRRRAHRPQGVARRAPAVARHQRADARRRGRRVALGQWAEAAAVVFLFAVAQALEVRTLERARRAIQLADGPDADRGARPRRGRRAARGRRRRSMPGAVIVVRPGEKIPLDGEVVAGTSAVNQAPVTGESLPADKAPGDEVFAGTINGRGALEVRVTRLRRDTTLARIIHLVERAQAQRAPSQSLVERFARVLHAGRDRAGGRRWPSCRRSRSAPTGASGSTARWCCSSSRARARSSSRRPCPSSRRWPAPPGRACSSRAALHLERTSRVRCVAFDKTGTLTRGAAGGGRRHRAQRRRAAAVVACAAAVEHRSAHPIAQAILRHAPRDGRVRRARRRRAGACRTRRRRARRRRARRHRQPPPVRGAAPVLAATPRAARRARRRAAARRCSSRATARRSASSPSPTGRARRDATRSTCCARRGSRRSCC